MEFVFKIKQTPVSTLTFKHRRKEKILFFYFAMHGVVESMILQREGRSRGRKNCKRVLIAVAFQLWLSRYAFIIIRNGRRRVKSLNAPWAYQLPLNFLLFKKRELFVFRLLYPTKILSFLFLGYSPFVWPFAVRVAVFSSRHTIRVPS